MPLDNMLGHLLSTIEPQRLIALSGASRGQPSAQKRNRSQTWQVRKMEMGYLHIDSSELRLESGKQPLIVAIDRVTKFTYVAFSTPRQNREHSIGDQSSALKVGFWSTYEGFRSSARSVALLMVAKR